MDFLERQELVRILTERMRLLREANGIFQKDVASSIGVAQSTYSLYEKGEREPSLKSLCDLADLYDVSTDYLLGRSNARYKKPEGKYAKVDSMVAQYAQSITELADKATEMGVYDVVFEGPAEPIPDNIEYAISPAVKRCSFLLDNIDMFKVKDEEHTYDGTKMLYFLGGNDNGTKDKP